MQIILPLIVGKENNWKSKHSHAMWKTAKSSVLTESSGWCRTEQQQVEWPAVGRGMSLLVMSAAMMQKCHKLLFLHLHISGQDVHPVHPVRM